MAQIFAGIFAEGSTDIRFLKPIIEKSLISVAMECNSQIDTEVFELEIDKSGKSFVEQVLTAASIGFDNFAIHILFVHTDADDSNNENVYKYKIEPVFCEFIKNSNLPALVAVVPIQEMESWMLADKELLKRELGTDKSDHELGIDRFPEKIRDPKAVIENAIRISREQLPKKRRSKLTIAELYQPIGTSLELEYLAKLSSFKDFIQNLKNAFIVLNLLKE